MTSGFSAFFIAVGAVTLAEMGDKTQLLAMCFAARYKAGKVLLGVFLATILNHAAAVAAGFLLKEILSAYASAIQIVASLSFIGFALWTIRGDCLDDACGNKTRFGPVITVAIAFFIAEMGDKTQLATVSLAAGFGNPVSILFGTTLGMLIADSIGIIFGVVMNRKIPEKVLKWVSASIFAICGLAGYIQASYSLISLEMLVITVILILALAVILALYIAKPYSKMKKVCDTYPEGNKSK